MAVGAPTPQDGEGLVSEEMVIAACRTWYGAHPHAWSRTITRDREGDMRDVLAAVAPDIAARARREALASATQEQAEVVRILGAALNYSDRGTGDHTSVTLAEEAASLIRSYQDYDDDPSDPPPYYRPVETIETQGDLL